MSAARRYVLAALAGMSPSNTDAVAVMVSELAANAVRHTGSNFTVSVDRSPELIRVSVSDSGPGDPVVREPHPAEPSGRGLQIVRALSADWGVIPAQDAQGKTVWFSIAFDPSPDETRVSVDARSAREPGTRIDVRREPSAGGECVRVTAVGEIDLASASRLRDALLRGAVEPKAKVLVDLGALDFIDSSGVHALLDAREALESNGGSLLVVAASRTVTRVLNVLGLSELLANDAAPA